MYSGGLPELPSQPGTRELIVDAADEFLKTHPFRDLTVSALMRATAASRPAFYQYFKSRYDVAEALTGRLALAAAESAATMFDTEADPAEACDAGIRRTVNNLGPHAYVVRALLDGAAADARLNVIWQSVFVRPYAEAIAQRVRMDQASGATPPTVDPELMGLALFTVTASLISDLSARLDDDDQRDQAAKALSRIWCAALYGKLLS